LGGIVVIGRRSQKGNGSAGLSNRASELIQRVQIRSRKQYVGPAQLSEKGTGFHSIADVGADATATRTPRLYFALKREVSAFE
jgi:hypothetical protein